MELFLTRCHFKKFNVILMICYYTKVFLILYFNEESVFRPWEYSYISLAQSVT